MPRKGYCSQCGKPVSADSKWRSTCSPECTQRRNATYRRNRDGILARSNARRRAFAETERCARPERLCGGCQQDIRHRRLDARYCSHKCAEAERRANRIVAFRAKVNTAQCRVCSEPITLSRHGCAQTCSSLCAEEFDRLRNRAKYRGLSLDQKHARIAASKASQRGLARISGHNDSRPWSPADVETAVRKDITVVEICHLLGRSYNNVIYRRRVELSEPLSARRAKYARRKQVAS